MSILRRSHGSVTFIFTTTSPATNVFLAGDFNCWNPQCTAMRRVEEGTWQVSIGLSPGSHQFKYVVDGEWMTDPDADLQVPNGLNGFNSVVKVPMDMHLELGETLPVDAVDKPDPDALERDPMQITTRSLRRRMLLQGAS